MSATELEAANGRSDLRRRARSQGYAEGSAMLQPTSPEGDKERAERLKASWEAIFGGAVGGRLFELVREHLSVSELDGYAREAISSLSSAAPGAAGGLMDDAQEAEALEKFLGALSETLKGSAEQWLQTEKGRKVLSAISQWTEEHPLQATLALGTAAIAAAVAAVLTNMETPELKTAFGSGPWSAEATAELGRLQELAVQAASLTVRYQADGIQVSAGAVYSREDDRAGVVIAGEGSTAAGRSTLDAAGSLEFYDDGTGVVSIDGGLRSTVEGTPLELGLGVDHGIGDSAASTAVVGRIIRGDEQSQRSLRGRLDPASGVFSISMGQSLTAGDTRYSRSTTFTNPGGMSEEGSIEHQFDDGLKADLTWAMSDAIEELGLTASRSTEGGYHGSASMTLDLKEDRLKELGLQLGWRDPERFRSVLLDYKRQWVPENRIYAHHFEAMAEYSIGKISSRLTAGVDTEGSQLRGSHVDLLAGYSLDQNWMLLSGIGYEHERMSDRGSSSGEFNAKAGLQYKDVAITMQYTPDTETWSLGISIPLGR